MFGISFNQFLAELKALEVAKVKGPMHACLPFAEGGGEWEWLKCLKWEAFFLDGLIKLNSRITPFLF